MNTRFTFLGRELQLQRYPAKLQHVSWQAWDAADEYLIEHVEGLLTTLNSPKLRIYNDDFGALGCWFNELRPDWISDSHIAVKSLQENLQLNGLAAENLQVYDCLASPEEQAELVLLKVPKTSALLEHQLIALQHCVGPNTKVIAAGKANAIQKSTLALFEKYLGPTTTSLARKKARLIFCEPSGDKRHNNPYPTVWQTQSPDLTLANHANVFARQQLDIGARLLLQHLPDCEGKKVVDLGCGNGVLGCAILQRYPQSKLVFVDESYMAVASAADNVATNTPDRLGDSEFLVSSCLEEYDQLQDASRPDLVVCNPPFHQQNAITDHIAFQMFKDAKFRLNQGGELRIIGNRHLDYPQKLKRLFGGYKVVASDRKFSILSAIKR